ncbi:MAG TPA: hypothetical protein VGS03_08105 [Candidatus Polarisedimenticolia bacterium]|jgi:ELWxxDGT repeat protein|nr:hypothetical protein [Candidatus Polarisedimenticolia bacterium]
MRSLRALAVVLSLFVPAVALASPGIPPVTSDGPARLLSDLNPQPDDAGRSSNPRSFTRFGDIFVFVADTHANGSEVWKSDGTAAGTSLLKDIRPGSESGLNWGSVFQPVNGVMVFQADDGVHGLEPWRTDGTAAGTFMLRDVRPGPEGGLLYRDGYNSLRTIGNQVLSGGLVYFLADDGEHGFELWRTDGTTAGTFLLQDIQPGPGSPFGTQNTFYYVDGATLGATFYFRATSAAAGAELWKTDGTVAGTRLVQDIIPGVDSSVPFGLNAINGVLVFGAAGRLYASDGSSVTVLSDVQPGCGYPTPDQFQKAGPFLYFQACRQLYRTDGTPGGTIFLREFTPFNGGTNMYFLGPVGGRLLFLADDGVHGPEPWSSDGTPAGTMLAKDINPTTSTYYFNFYLNAGTVTWFMADDGLHGRELWRTDGTPSGTRLVADLTPGPGSTDFVSMIPWQGGLIFASSLGLFRIDSGTEEFTRIAPFQITGGLRAVGSRAVFSYDDGVHGKEPWETDGTEEGTGLLKDINDVARTLASSPIFIGTATGSGGAARALYDADDGLGRSLWVTDGTPRGTARLVPSLELQDAGTVVDGIVYFPAADPVHGARLWRSDGTSAGTRIVSEEPGPVLWRPGRCGKRVCFFALNADQNLELWSSDGTEAGTALLPDAIPSANHFYPFDLYAEVGETLYFDGADDVAKLQLWATDGTVAGTHVVIIGPGFSGHCCNSMTPFNGGLLVQAYDPLHGWEPWITDGTAAGTSFLKDIARGVTGSTTEQFSASVVAGGVAYFLADDGIHGFEVWRTDGTEAGTLLLKDIVPGSASSWPVFLGPIGDFVVFMTLRSELDDAYDVWRSDGTEAGTVRVRDSFPSFFRNSTTWSGAFDGGILFDAPDEEHGLELWRTDGTPEGTVFVQDIAPGPDSSYARNFVQVGSSIVFTAEDPVASTELFSGRAAILLGHPEQAARDLKDELLRLGLPRGITKSLSAPLDAAAAALAAGRDVQAEIALGTFIRLVDADSPRFIGEDDAANLTQFAQDLLKLIATSPASQNRSAPKPAGPRQLPEP